MSRSVASQHPPLDTWRFPALPVAWWVLDAPEPCSPPEQAAVEEQKITIAVTPIKCLQGPYQMGSWVLGAIYAPRERKLCLPFPTPRAEPRDGVSSCSLLWAHTFPVHDSWLLGASPASRLWHKAGIAAIPLP